MSKLEELIVQKLLPEMEFRYIKAENRFEECVSHTLLDYVKSPKYFEHGDILFLLLVRD